jgi:hypothetical protein
MALLPSAMVLSGRPLVTAALLSYEAAGTLLRLRLAHSRHVFAIAYLTVTISASSSAAPDESALQAAARMGLRQAPANAVRIPACPDLGSSVRHHEDEPISCWTVDRRPARRRSEPAQERFVPPPPLSPCLSMYSCVW